MSKGTISEQEPKTKLLRNILMPTNPTQSLHNNSGSDPPLKNTSKKNKKKSTTPEVSNQATPPNTLALPVRNDSIDYNIVEDMKRESANISIFYISNIIGQHEMIIQQLAS